MAHVWLLFTGTERAARVCFYCWWHCRDAVLKHALEQPGHYPLYANRTRQSAVLRTVLQKKALGNRYTDILSRQDGPFQAGEVSGRISSQIIEC